MYIKRRRRRRFVLLTVPLRRRAGAPGTEADGRLARRSGAVGAASHRARRRRLAAVVRAARRRRSRSRRDRSRRAEHDREIEDDHYGVLIPYAFGPVPDQLRAVLARSADPISTTSSELVPTSWDELIASIKRFVDVGTSKFVVLPVDEPKDADAWVAHLGEAAEALLPLESADPARRAAVWHRCDSRGNVGTAGTEWVRGDVEHSMMQRDEA